MEAKKEMEEDEILKMEKNSKINKQDVKKAKNLENNQAKKEAVK